MGKVRETPRFIVQGQVIGFCPLEKGFGPGGSISNEVGVIGVGGAVPDMVVTVEIPRDIKIRQGGLTR